MELSCSAYSNEYSRLNNVASEKTDVKDNNLLLEISIKFITLVYARNCMLVLACRTDNSIGKS